MSYKIELAPLMVKARNVVHISCLEPCIREERQKGVDVIIEADGNIEQEIDAITKPGSTFQRRQYLVRFVCQTDEEAIWVTKEELRNAKELTCNFRDRIEVAGDFC